MADTTGAPEQMSTVGFGTSQVTKYIVNGTITMPIGNVPPTFTVPYDATLKKICVSFSLYDTSSIAVGETLTLYVIIATAAADSDFFTLQAVTETDATSYVGGGTYTDDTVMLGDSGPLSVPLMSGTRVAICVAVKVANATKMHQRTVYCSGSLMLG
jgi:hypothetical protein